MLAFSDLLKAQTRDEIVELLLTIATDLGLSVSAWQSGQPLRTFLVTIAQKMADLSSLDVEVTRSGFLDLATLAWMKLKAKSDYNVDFVPAEYATGLVDFTNASVTAYPALAGDITVAHNVTGKTFHNVEDITIPASGSLADVAIEANEIGTGSDAAPGTITEMVTKLAGVTVTNPLSVLGADEEKAPALASRCREKLGSLSPDGPKEAYSFVAKDQKLSPTLSPITRTRTVASIVTGIVTEYIANAAGAPDAGDVDIVQAGIDVWAEPQCVESAAVAATPNVQDVTSTVWIRSSLSEAGVRDLVATALAEYYASAPIGGEVIDPDPGKIFVATLEHVIDSAAPGIVKVVVALPAADVAMALNEVPELGTVTTTVIFL